MSISKSLKKFEDLHTGGETVGAPTLRGISSTHTAGESGTVRLVCTMCKSFAKGADEKSSCHRHWKTYMRNLNIRKMLLQSFHGNRFNIIFLLGGCSYHLRQHALNFLEKVHGTSNLLLKALLADLKVPVYLAGCRVP